MARRPRDETTVETKRQVAVSAASRPPDESHLAEEIQRRLGPLLPGGAANSQVIERVMSLVVEETFSGPVPHPRHYAQYEQILPGSADRLLTMAEKALDHNMEVGKLGARQAAEEGTNGMNLGFAGLVLLVVGAVISILVGSEIGAGLFLGTGALGVLGMFLKRGLNK